MSLLLPSPLPHYFTAKNAHDVDAMITAFADDASVRDEGQDLIGRTSIRRWMAETTRKYRVTVTPTGLGETDGKTIVTAQVSGNFPGSPVELRYQFTLVGEKISRLEIH